MQSRPAPSAALMTAVDEIEELTATYGGAVLDVPTGQRYLVLDRFPLGEGWAPPVSPLAIHITGYPEAALDGFYIPGSVRLASGAQPTNANLSSPLGQTCGGRFRTTPRAGEPGSTTCAASSVWSVSDSQRSADGTRLGGGCARAHPRRPP